MLERLSVVGEQSAARAMKFEKKQLTLEGSTITEAQQKEALLQVPNVDTRCPFCLHRQTTRQMCFFLSDGKLSAMRKCVSCGKTMQASSAVAFLRGAAEYGRWVASYPRFWQSVNHDALMEALQSLKELKLLDVYDFWRAYREVKPKPRLDKDGYPIRDKDGAMTYETSKKSDAQDHGFGAAWRDAPTSEFEFVKVSDGTKWTLVGTSIGEEGDYWRIHTGDLVSQRVSKEFWRLETVRPSRGDAHGQD